MKQSAGLLLFRKSVSGLEFFLVHPGGPFFLKKDLGFWTIPKGELMDDEEPLDAAIREFEEEIGTKPKGNFIALRPIIQKGGKKVLCWAFKGDCNLKTINSNTFEIEWPPRSGKMQTYPEIDRANWFIYDEAIQYINERQIPFLDELLKILG